MERSYTIKSSIDEIGPVIEEMLSYLKKDNIQEGILHDIKLAVEETIVNAIKHGNKFREDLPVRISFEIASPLTQKCQGLAMTVKDEVRISVEDCGEGYDYKRIPDPTLDENIPKGHGRGVFLIRRLMDEVRFNDRGNRIEMVKYIKC